MEDEDYHATLECFSKAKAAADTLGDPGLRVFVRIGLSRYCRQIGDLSAAWDWRATPCSSPAGQATSIIMPLL